MGLWGLLRASEGFRGSLGPPRASGGPGEARDAPEASPEERRHGVRDRCLTSDGWGPRGGPGGGTGKASALGE
jgi:hypothetical protein